MNTFDHAYNVYADRIARNCSDNWIRKAYNVCVKLWDATADWAKNYVFDPSAKLAQRIVRKVVKMHKRSVRSLANNIVWEASPLKGNVHYLVYFYKKDGSFLFAKSGKAHEVVSRIKSELCDEYAQYGAYSAKVVRVDFCGDDKTAGHLEEAYRVELKFKHDYKYYVPNDRWTIDVFDLAEYDAFVKNFFKKIEKKA